MSCPAIANAQGNDQKKLPKKMHRRPLGRHLREESLL
jgi:hypothetical protein